MEITVPEAARRVGRNPETIRRWIWSGKLSSRKVGNQHLVEDAHVDALAGVPFDWEAWMEGVRALQAMITDEERRRLREAWPEIIDSVRGEE